jgi:two-component system, OmpR family, sensor kinase
VELSKLAKQVVAERALVAADKGVDLGVVRDETATVRGDAESLRILLANLVDNAIRYTPRDGRIDVSVHLQRGAPALEVTDTGPGIPEAERGRVFDRFYRRAGSGAGGNGLGLAIVRNIAERHGASIDLVDGPGGRGLSARVTFPAATARGNAEVSLTQLTDAA